MEARQAIEILHIIELLASCELEARHMRDIIELIERLDEQNQTQAQVLAARDRVIERQERMIEKACEWMQKIGCPTLDNHYCDENCSTEMNGAGCWRRWLEEEASS